MSDIKTWAAALGRIPSGLFILTARQGEQETGMLASWVQQCSFDPPLLSAAMKRGRPLSEWLCVGEAVVVNVLEEGQTDMVAFFGRGVAPAKDALAELETERAGDGTAILAESLAYLECRVESSVPSGDHELLLLRILGGRVLGEGKPMIHVRKNGLHY